MRTMALVGVMLVGLGGRALAQATVTTSVDAKNTCLKTTDPRGSVVVRGNATAATAALKSIAIQGAKVTVTCQPEPPPPGSIISDGRPAVQKQNTLAEKTVRATGGRKSLSVALTLDLRSFAKECSDGGHPPFSSMNVAWSVSAVDATGATGTQTGSLMARCDDGTSSCLSRPAPKRVTCGSDTCDCGLRCCPYADPDGRCVSDALCRKLQRLQEQRDRDR